MTDTIHAALAAANADLTNPGKDGHANYGTYTTLAGVLAHVRPVMARHGLFIAQDVSNDDTHLIVTTAIRHASGECLTFGPLTWPMVDKIQTLGGLMTYTRRYALMAALGLSGMDEDDDGQAANEQAQRSATPVGGLRGPAARNMTGPATTAQVGAITKIMRAQGLNEIALNTLSTAELGFEMPRDGIAHLTKGQASALIERMTAPSGITRHKPTEPDPDDPWAMIPVTAPGEGA